MARSVDVERISEGVEFLHELWASLLSIPLAVVVLYFQVRSPSLHLIQVDPVYILGRLGSFHSPDCRRWTFHRDIIFRKVFSQTTIRVVCSDGCSN